MWLVAIVGRICIRGGSDGTSSSDLVVDREPFFISWTGERLDLLARGLLSRVTAVKSRSRTAFPPAEASLEREVALPVSSQSTPPSARFSDIDGLSWVMDEPARDTLGRAVFATENDVFLGDMGVHSRADGSRDRISQVADDEIVSWRERRFHAYEAFSCSERNADARSHRSVLVDNNFHSTAGGPELLRNLATMTVRKVSFDARVLAALFSSTGCPFRKWEDVVLDSFACNYKYHLVTRRE